MYYTMGSIQKCDQAISLKYQKAGSKKLKWIKLIQPTAHHDSIYENEMISTVN